MSGPRDDDKTTAGTAALFIRETTFLSLNDLKIIDDRMTRGLLEDAALGHRNADPALPDPAEHRAIAALIDRLIEEATASSERSGNANIPAASPDDSIEMMIPHSGADQQRALDIPAPRPGCGVNRRRRKG